VLFSSCKFGKVYTYDIRLERPAYSKDLRFENDSLAISFKFHPTYIEFDLYNKLDEALKINWRDLSLSIDGDTKIAVPSYYAYTNRLVAPRSTIKELIKSFNKEGFSSPPGMYPEGYLNTYPIRDNRWEPYRNYILSLKGRKIVIYLPFYLKDVYCSKTFEFVIADVQPKN
jgi:hypothetical protein